MPIRVRPVEETDIPAIAALRAQGWESISFWEHRIRRYLSGEHSPQRALPPRAAFVAVDAGSIVGFVSGHCTRRYGCDAELQWINVDREYRQQGIAGLLLRAMVAWFIAQNAARICVNVAAENAAARRLYAKYGAQALNAHWMIWENVTSIDTLSREIPS